MKQLPDKIQQLPDGNYWLPDLTKKYGGKVIYKSILSGMMFQLNDLVIRKE